MFIAHAGVSKAISMGISDYPRRVTAFCTKTAKETELKQWNIVNGTMLSVGFILNEVNFYKILAYNKRNKVCGEAEVSVIPCPPELVPRPSGRRRIFIR